MISHPSARRVATMLAVAALAAGVAAHAGPVHAAEAGGKLRYDGLYRTRPQVAATLQYRRYIRFYPNGEAIAVGSTGTLESIVRSLNAGLGAYFPHGRVTRDGDRIAIHDPNCDYTGKIAGKRLRLMRTCSNEQKPSVEEYEFVAAPLTPRQAPPAGGMPGAPAK